MKSGTNVLTYNLYLDAAHAMVWGDGTGGTSIYGPITPPNKTDVYVPIYAGVPAQQDVATGSYTDSITATINF